MATKAFRRLFLISLGLAILAVVTPLAVRPASTVLAIRASALVAASWVAIVLYAFIKFKKPVVSARHASDCVLVFRALCDCLGLCPQFEGLSLMVVNA